MRGASLAFFAWAAWLGALALMLLIWSSSHVEPALLGGGAVLVALLGAFCRLAPDRQSASRVVPQSSIGAIVLAAGLALAAFGLTAGLWLILVGAEAALFGAGLLLRERRGDRRGSGS